MKLVSDYIKIKDDVYEAMSTYKPVVALDSSIITHSLPHPLNLQTVLNIKKFLNENGTVLAVLGMIDGYVNIGLSDKELEFFTSPSNFSKIKKIDRKDFSAAIVKKLSGPFSISAGLLVANMVGLRVMLTDGIDGIFGKSSIHSDIFADLNELESTNVTLVCSGIRPLFSLKETINELKRLSIPIYGYKTSYIPNFFSGNSDFFVDFYIDSLDEFVDIMKVKKHFKLKGGQLLVVPTPTNFILDNFLIQNNTRSIKSQILNDKVNEENMNMYFFEKMKEQTDGKSVITHSQSIFYNAKVASIVAQKYLKKI